VCIFVSMLNFLRAWCLEVNSDFFYPGCTCSVSNGSTSRCCSTIQWKVLIPCHWFIVLYQTALQIYYRCFDQCVEYLRNNVLSFFAVQRWYRYLHSRELCHFLPNVIALIATDKVTRAVKLCFSEILQFLSEGST